MAERMDLRSCGREITFLYPGASRSLIGCANVLAVRCAPIRSSADAEILGKLRVHSTCVTGSGGVRVGLRWRLRPVGGDAAETSSVVLSEAGVATGARSRRPTGAADSFLTVRWDEGAGEALLTVLARGGRPRGFFSFSGGIVSGMAMGLRGSKPGAVGDSGALGVPGVATGVHLVALPVFRSCLETGVFGRDSLGVGFGGGAGGGASLTSGARPLLGL